jgi:type I restriction enzyme M protein
MNLFIHGLDGDIQPGNSYFDDKHPKLRADYVIANPPFNDGSKAERGWGADKIVADDPRLVVGGEPMPLSPRNANAMWILHFLHHLKDGGTAGFVMATGELSSAESSRMEVRKALIERGYVDAVVQLTGQLFANTQIPCALWFLSKNRDGKAGFRRRTNEILFIDGRKLGSMIPGSRRQKLLSDAEIDSIAAVYREFRHVGPPNEVPGFARVASIDEIRGHRHVLTPGRYVGSVDSDVADEAIEDSLPRLAADLERQFAEGHRLAAVLKDQLSAMNNGL